MDKYNCNPTSYTFTIEQAEFIELSAGFTETMVPFRYTAILQYSYYAQLCYHVKLLSTLVRMHAEATAIQFEKKKQ